jgi:hypothetical protein
LRGKIQQTNTHKIKPAQYPIILLKVIELMRNIRPDIPMGNSPKQNMQRTGPYTIFSFKLLCNHLKEFDSGIK